ncbi:hypothetical protein GJ496_004078 [Pomphorhynchus laevis]|nr:hypothetical protein GJ496_004078 [Pomphorhynchus laevis]
MVSRLPKLMGYHTVEYHYKCHDNLAFASNISKLVSTVKLTSLNLPSTNTVYLTIVVDRGCSVSLVVAIVRELIRVTNINKSSTAFISSLFDV